MEREKVSASKVKELSSKAPKKGNVEVRLKNPKKTGTVTLRGYNGPDGIYRPYVDQYGQHRVLRIKRTLFLNMENEDDRLTLEQVRYHPIYVKSANPSLVIVDHNTEAEEFVTKKDLSAKADAIISKLDGEDLKDFARILLVTVKPGSSDGVIKRTLYEKAALEPQLVLDEWNDDNREIKSIVRKSVEKGIIETRHGRYTFNGDLMGTNFEMAVDWLKKNEDLIPSFEKLLVKA